MTGKGSAAFFFWAEDGGSYDLRTVLTAIALVLIAVSPVMEKIDMGFFSSLFSSGRLDFWKVANKHPDLAYNFFREKACFFVFEDGLPENYKNIVPSSEWVGPFLLIIPKLGYKKIKVFGKRIELEQAQNEFLSLIK